MSKITSNQKREILILVQKRIADFQSLYPDLTMVLTGPCPTSALSCLALLGAVLLVTGRNDIRGSEKIVRMISNLCYRHQYQGKWEQVQEVLEQVLDFSEYRAIVTSEIMSQNDYYGNLEKQIYSYLRLLEPKAEGYQSGRVRRPARKRGYNDKGNERPKWTLGRNQPIEDTRIDRRQMVLHPLVGEIRKDYDYRLDEGFRKNSEDILASKLRQEKMGGETKCQYMVPSY